MEISERKKRENANVHKCVSTRSSNIGADKSVTVPARASRIRAKRDMIESMMMIMMSRDGSSRSVAVGWTSVGLREHGVRNGDADGVEGWKVAVMVQMSLIFMWGVDIQLY